MSERRRAAAAKQRRTAVLVSVASTAVVFGLLAWWVSRSATWPSVQRQFFSWEDIQAAWPRVWRGFLLNMRIWLIAQVFIVIFALLLAIMRSLHGPFAAPLRVFAVVYIDVIRGIPALLLILLLGFGVPALQLEGLPTGGLFWGSVAMIAAYSAYTAEVFRSGMDAVHDSQRMAAKALGLNQWQSLRHAVLPQAIRNVVPALLNGSVSLQKDVALLSVLGIRDAVREAQIYTARTFNYSSLIAATILFLAASIPLARFTDWYARRDRARRSQVML
jgi:polar amino acid transport system permease protein